MSFAKFKEKVENGDTVMLYLGFDNMHCIVVKDGVTFQTRYGALKHADLIGVRYGSRVHCKKGYLYVLHPTPEFWTNNLPHRTQILYSTDISVITLQLDLRPGSIVVESGTGSGSLSHAILRSIAPTGHLYTFEFHEKRALLAAQEFLTHGVDENVTVTHRDVCQDGFRLTNVADAVFLDLPKPWEVIPSAKQAIKLTGGRICSFSPCIEQVQRTCEVLTQHGFTELKTMECLLRNYDVRTINLPLADLGPSNTENNSNEVSENQAESTEECKPSELNFKTEVTESTEKSKSDELNVKVEVSTEQCKQEPSDEPSLPKKQKTESVKNTRHDFDLIGKKDEQSFFFKTAAPQVQMPGHTGFLTFATLYPV